MSNVHPGDRKESPMEFLDTARKIEIRAMEICHRWPKSYTFYITQRTVALASEIYEHAQKANVIMPKTEAECIERILELERAMGANTAFSQKIELAYSLFPICGHKEGRSKGEEDLKSSNVLQEFMSLCVDEEDALKGNLTYVRNVMKSNNKDSNRKRDAPV